MCCSRQRIDTLLKAQSTTALRTSCAYRTVSYAAANIIVAMPPIDLLMAERTLAHYNRRSLEIDYPEVLVHLREQTLQQRSERIRTKTKGAWTRTLIQDVAGWCRRRNGHLSFHLTQMLSGHG
ncbi:PREDICTED: uncharacterized protein LOC107170953 [Diuraphis noxia]|uniref:uncharacterized protein LOC107170953 n=1 Tax=Diuraphis noxia TaxID=143948 RepID=UPI0007637639|nr:PREDICTED: uncharacterized protein LOC107170953 [Diuraphis noxia]